MVMPSRTNAPSPTWDKISEKSSELMTLSNGSMESGPNKLLQAALSCWMTSWEFTRGAGPC